MFNNSTEEMDNRNGFSSTLLTFAAVLTFLIMAIGIFGNFLTVIALLKCPKVRNVAAAFIISLCLADLIFCVLVLPFSALRFIEGTWTHGDVLCKLIPFIQYGNIGVSLLCIAMITINRYVMITHHNSYSKLYKKHWIAVMITFCWMFSYGMQMPTLLGFWGVFDYDPKLGTCSIMNDTYGRSSKTTLFTTAFFIPCLIIIACYTKIFWVVHKSELRLKKHDHKQNSVLNNQRQFSSSNNQNTTASLHVGSESSFSVDTKEGSSQKPTRIKDQRDLRTKRNEWRITKMVLAIFLSFLVCYFPITLAKVADKNVHHPTFHIFSYMMLYLSACINPIIYVIMNKQYRKAYKTVLLCGSSRILLFVKPLSSAEEKWKDTGLSNNHSRTVVSQMSLTEPQSTSFSKSHPQTKAEMEMTSRLATAVDHLNSMKSDTINSSAKLEYTTNPLRSTQMAHSTSIIATVMTLNQNQESYKEVLARADINLGNEEGLNIQRRNSNHPLVRRANCLTAVNLQTGKPKKIQYCGQNITDIPDNNSKD